MPLFKRDVITLDKALEAARFCLSAGDLPRAYAMWENMNSANPAHVSTLSLKAELLDRTGQRSQAADCWKQVAVIQDRLLSSDKVSHALETLKRCGFTPQAVLDIGAHSGTWTEELQAVFPGARSLMIEAQPEAEPLLASMAAEHSKSIDYRITLLGEKTAEKTPFFISNENMSTGSSRYVEQTNHSFVAIDLPMSTLDNLVANHPWRPFDLMKLDVQGAERDVLAGAGHLMEEVQVIITELSLVEYNKGGVRMNEMMTLLDNRGFRLFDLFGHSRSLPGALKQVDGIFIRKDRDLQIEI